MDRKKKSERVEKEKLNIVNFFSTSSVRLVVSFYLRLIIPFIINVARDRRGMAKKGTF